MNVIFPQESIYLNKELINQINDILTTPQFVFDSTVQFLYTPFALCKVAYKDEYNMKTEYDECNNVVRCSMVSFLDQLLFRQSHSLKDQSMFSLESTRSILREFLPFVIALKDKYKYISMAFKHVTIVLPSIQSSCVNDN